MTPARTPARPLLSFAIAASAVNLQMLPVWRELADPDSAEAYFLPAGGRSAALSTLLAFVLLVAAVWALLSAMEKTPGLRGAVAVLFVFCLLNPLTHNGYPLFERRWLLALYDAPFILAAAAIGAILALALTWRFHRRVLKLAAIVLVLGIPFALLNVGKAAWYAISAIAVGEAAAPSGRSGAAATGIARSRLVWIVFDELDQRAVFEERPKGLSLPAFDAFYRQAFVATQVAQAASDTITAIPGMVTGRKVESATPEAADRLVLRLTGAPTPSAWEKTAGAFAAIARLGVRTGIVGWYHPYCRLFQGLYADCVQLYLGTTVISDGESLMHQTLARLQSIVPLYRRQNAVRAFNLSLEETLRLVRDPTLGFLFIHVPLPHDPPVYDRARGTFTAWNFSRTGYFDNVAAADLFLAAVDSALEQAGLRESTAVLITADHGWRGAAVDGRTRDARIPFLLRLAGNQPHRSHAVPFAAAVIGELAAAVIGGQVATFDDLIGFLKKTPSAAY